MCSVCRQHPCHPMCPNAPEPPAVYTCESCKEPIRAGEEYFELDGEYWHEECASDNAMAILTELCGATIGTADEVDCCDEY